MPICPSCAKEVAQATAFCPHCGAVLDRPATGSNGPGATPPPAPEIPMPGERAAAPPASREAVRERQAAAATARVRHETGDVGGYIVRRFLALVVDLAGVGALIGVATRVWMANASHGEPLSAATFAQLLLLTGIGFFIYRWLFEGLVGTTIGKLIFGLSVSRFGGGSAGIGRALIRTIVLPVDLAVIGFLLAAVTPSRRRLGDYVAGTAVGNSPLGALAPVIGLILIASAGYGDLLFAGGPAAASNIARDAGRLAPTLFGGAGPSPMPSASVAPTIAPIFTPTAVPTSQPSPLKSPTPSPSPTPVT